MPLSKAFFTGALMLSMLTAFALDPGRRAPEIIVDKWLSKDAPQELKAKDPVDVVMIFDAAAPGAFAFLKMLESVREADSGNIRNITAIARNPASVVEELLARNGELSIQVGVDTTDYVTFKSYCDTESVLPMAFVLFKNGTVAWSGHPTGVASVAKRIADDTFSVESQRRISILRSELQTSLQSGLGAVVQRNAERILELDPGDMIAVQAKLFIFESDGKYKEAIEFLSKACQKSPKDQELRLAFLSLLIRSGELDAFKAETLKCQKDFKDSYVFQGRLCSFLLESSPFGLLPLDIALAAADAYAAGLNSSATKDKQALSFELRARTSYCAGRMASAVDFQAKASALRKGGPFEAPAAKLLDFYKQAEALSKR